MWGNQTGYSRVCEFVVPCKCRYRSGTLLQAGAPVVGVGLRGARQKGPWETDRNCKEQGEVSKSHTVYIFPAELVLQEEEKHGIVPQKRLPLLPMPALIYLLGVSVTAQPNKQNMVGASSPVPPAWGNTYSQGQILQWVRERARSQWSRLRRSKKAERPQSACVLDDQRCTAIEAVRHTFAAWPEADSIKLWRQKRLRRVLVPFCRGGPWQEHCALGWERWGRPEGCLRKLRRSCWAGAFHLAVIPSLPNHLRCSLTHSSAPGSTLYCFFFGPLSLSWRCK